jgi:hypothetical protein
MDNFGIQFFFLHPTLAPYWDASVFLRYSPEQLSLRCPAGQPELLIPATIISSITPAYQELAQDPSQLVFGTLPQVPSVPATDRARQIAESQAASARDAVEAWNAAEHQAKVSLGTSSAALVVISVLILVMVGFAEHETGVEMDDVHSRLRSLEHSSKFIQRYVHMVQSCSIHDSDLILIKANAGSFLSKISGFVSKIRRYLPQSSFGDMENVPLTGANTSRAGMKTDMSSEDQAIRELHLRDLRTDVGMQVVNGTVMCLSLLPFNRMIDVELGNAHSEDFLSNVVQGKVSQFLTQAEKIINGTTGVIHCLTGDSMWVLWNVTSSTPTPHVSAVRCALLLLKKTGEFLFSTPLSMGIAQSFMLAGNLDVCKRKGLSLCGPAMVLAERLEVANAAHKTSIMISAPIAETIASTVFTDLDFTVRPVALCRCKIRGEPDDLYPGYAVLPTRMKQDRLKAWQTTFKELLAKFSSGLYAEALKVVDDHRAAQALAEKAGGAGGGGGYGGAAGKAGKAQPVDRTVEFYRRYLAHLIHVESSKNTSQHIVGL